MGSGHRPPPVRTRIILNRRNLFVASTTVFTGATALGGYAFAAEPMLRLDVATHRLTPPRWPAGLRLRVALLADIHAGLPYMGLDRIEAIVEETNLLTPDLILLPGDFTPAGNFVTEVIPRRDVARALAKLRARHGVFAVNGNHDCWEDKAVLLRPGGVSPIARALDAAGIPLLANQAVRAGPVQVAGLQSSWSKGPWDGAADIPGTLAQCRSDTPILMMVHEPDIFPLIPPEVSVTFCGHTHGGQVRVLGFSPRVPSRYGNRYAYGHVIEDGRHLVVSGGLGVSTIPVRFGVPPEITMVELG